MKLTYNLIWLGLLFMLLAFGCETVTVVGSDYRPVLTLALLFLIVADACLIWAFKRGGKLAKVIGIIILLPNLFIIPDFLQRAPYAFFGRENRQTMERQ